MSTFLDTTEADSKLAKPCNKILIQVTKRLRLCATVLCVSLHAVCVPVGMHMPSRSLHHFCKPMEVPSALLARRSLPTSGRERGFWQGKLWTPHHHMPDATAHHPQQHPGAAQRTTGLHKSHKTPQKAKAMAPFRNSCAVVRVETRLISGSKHRTTLV